MPAVTADTLSLPRLPEPTPEARPRPVTSVTSAPRGFEGEGFPVRRAFAGVPQEVLDPFIHMDEMGEVDYGPGEPRGTSWHPHRGFETVTYMIDGTFQHRDSTGGGGLIADGATQWMTAGAGILHIERAPEELLAAGGGHHRGAGRPRDGAAPARRSADRRAGGVAWSVRDEHPGRAAPGVRGLPGRPNGHDPPVMRRLFSFPDPVNEVSARIVAAGV